MFLFCFVVNQARLNDYLGVDISALYQINFKVAARANIGLSVWNILDKEKTINTFYRVGAPGTAEQGDQNSLGITPNAVFRVYL
ncbi:MAG: hypothetical protein ACFCUL_05600 [Flavobacteriaceae bacterium]